MTLDALLQRGLLPDWAVRAGIRRLLRTRLRREKARVQGHPARALERYAAQLREEPIAIETDQANTQHYEVPAAFFETVLGEHRKYSCGLWEEGTTDLSKAEAAMLRMTVERGELRDGMRVLDLGCGWGSLTFWIAEHFPACEIVAVSNSNEQRRSIEKRCNERGYENVRVLTCDVNDLDPGQTFDRVFSIEMFEHVRNYEALLARCAKWLKPEGRAFVHIFVHQTYAYPFDDHDTGSWMARHFFTGGQMPADQLLYEFQNDLEIERHWTVNGTHYARTARAWLDRLADHQGTLRRVLTRDGDPASGRRALAGWRIFFMACEELWGFEQGAEWYVAHYLLRPRNEAPVHNPSGS